MSHYEIQAQIRTWITTQMVQPFTLLDLGCGDAKSIDALFEGTPLQVYTGVDLSPVALGAAAENLAGVSFGVDLMEDDFIHYLTTCDSDRFDIILSGFSLHHLHFPEKRAYFKLSHAALKPLGHILLYDTFLRSGESREDYLSAYCHNLQTRWTQLSPECFSELVDHIQTCDFPETYDSLSGMAAEAGFDSPTYPLFSDALQFHRLYYFQARSDRD